MKYLLPLFFLSSLSFAQSPIALHPENPHYFIYKEDPVVLITSAEHYGAVLNGDFDYITYLNTLATDKMNYTRIFAGSYFEIPGTSFGIKNNTLAPDPGSVVVPWKSARENGKTTYYLDEWNETYFNRLHAFVKLAAQKDIIVEVTLFSSVYTDAHWDINPQNPANTPNLEGTPDRRLVHTLENGRLLKFQEAYVRKLVRELNPYANVFFEIQNEPWSDRPLPVYNIVNKEALEENDWTNKSDLADSMAMAWQDHMVSVIRDEEENLPNRHLIAQNYTNFRVSLPGVNEEVDILNFHYAWPEAVWWNYHYDKPIGFDESGFAGSGDKVYRRQAWRFMVSGGALFNNLDYSFAVGHEKGDLENEAPGGGGSTLRQQLGYLHEFMDLLPLPEMKPARDMVGASPGMIPYVLATEDKSVVAVFIQMTGRTRAQLELFIPEASYEVIRVDPLSGEKSVSQVITHQARMLLPVLAASGEIAYLLRRKE